MTQKKNALFFLFDSLRYDVFSDMRRAQVLAPNLVKLIERGFLCPVISNGNATQFVMPSLFSLTYPLDYGGYSNGVVDRPKTFPELLREAGYDTHLTTTLITCSPATGTNADSTPPTRPCTTAGWCTRASATRCSITWSWKKPAKFPAPSWKTRSGLKSPRSWTRWNWQSARPTTALGPGVCAGATNKYWPPPARSGPWCRNTRRR